MFQGSVRHRPPCLEKKLGVIMFCADPVGVGIASCVDFVLGASEYILDCKAT